LQLTRQRYQLGSLRKLERKKGPSVWEFRYRDKANGGRQKQVTLSALKHPTEAHARRAVERLVMKLNAEDPLGIVADPIFGTLIDRFIEEEKLLEICQQRVGETVIDGLQFSTACSYMSILEKHIRPRWGTIELSKVRPIHIQEWLKQLDAAPRYKSKIKALIHRLFEKAMLWELLEVQRNPLELVEIRGISKRRKRPLVLTLEQYFAVLAQLPEPYRTMVIVAQCLGLRVSEILALKWQDVDFDNLKMRVTRKVVNGRVSTVKTEYSEDDLPLDQDFSRELLQWKTQCRPSFEGWLFPAPLTGRPYYASEIQKDYLKTAGEKIGVSQNGKAVSLGWHSFRHTYRSLLDASGAPIGVQQKLMRHAQVATTMDVYGNALMESKREANSKVVRMVLRPSG
jgi:integrase